MSVQLLLDELLAGGTIYIANRLFDVEEKVKSERLEQAILNGVHNACNQANVPRPKHKVTFVPFRDAGQEELDADQKTRLLYEEDIRRLENTVLMVANIDGLSKDEGVCFELGLAFAKRIPILLLSTDFISHLLPSGIDVPLDPLLWAAANHVIRVPNLCVDHEVFLDNLITTREHILQSLSVQIRTLMLASKTSNFSKIPPEVLNNNRKHVFLDFGGELFEWQTMLADQLVEIAEHNPGITIHRPRRYEPLSDLGSDFEAAALSLARCDLKRAIASDYVVICSDADECPSGSAFLQGLATGLSLETWMYNSKKTKITGPGGYLSSRNLMLDYSANKAFTYFTELTDCILNLR